MHYEILITLKIIITGSYLLACEQITFQLSERLWGRQKIIVYFFAFLPSLSFEFYFSPVGISAFNHLRNIDFKTTFAKRLFFQRLIIRG